MYMYTSTMKKRASKTIIPESNPKNSAICKNCGRQFIPVTSVHPLCAYCKIDKEVKAKYEKKM